MSGKQDSTFHPIRLPGCLWICECTLSSYPLHQKNTESGAVPTRRLASWTNWRPSWITSTSCRSDAQNWPSSSWLTALSLHAKLKKRFIGEELIDFWRDYFWDFIWVWINTYRYIFSGMNIHKSQLFWCELQGYYWFWPIPISGILFEGSDSCWTAQIQPPLERPRSTTDSAWSLPRWSTGRRLDGLEVLNSFWGFDMGNQKAILELWFWLEASLQFSGLYIYIYNIFILLVMPHFFCRWRLFFSW